MLDPVTVLGSLGAKPSSHPQTREFCTQTRLQGRQHSFSSLQPQTSKVSLGKINFNSPSCSAPSPMVPTSFFKTTISRLASSGSTTGTCEQHVGHTPHTPTHLTHTVHLTHPQPHTPTHLTHPQPHSHHASHTPHTMECHSLTCNVNEAHVQTQSTCVTSSVVQAYGPQTGTHVLADSC